MAERDYAAMGRKGGLTTAAKHGPGHMAKIGALGFASYASAYAGGNKAMARRMLGLDGIRRDYRQTPGEWMVWLDEQRKG